VEPLHPDSNAYRYISISYKAARFEEGGGVNPHEGRNFPLPSPLFILCIFKESWYDFSFVD
jgi:hypothetical protein